MKTNEEILTQLSTNTTSKDLLKCLHKNKVSPGSLEYILNTLLNTDRLTIFWGKPLKGNNEIHVILDYKGARDIANENIVMSITYYDGLFLRNQYKCNENITLSSLLN